MSFKAPVKSIGVLGFGAFGRLIAEHLHPYFEITVSDPALAHGDNLATGVRTGDASDVGRADLVILAVPLEELETSIRLLRPHLRPGGIVMDVTSVKVEPVRLMEAGLPPHVEIVGTHPLFGPQSSVDGIAGRKIVVCPVRGRSAWRVAAFFRRVLKLKVYITSPEEHDREAAMVQGITHLVARCLIRMEPLPSRLTTPSFDLLMQATEMVRHDSESVFLAIERDNPYSAEMRQRYFKTADEVRTEVDAGEHQTGSPSKELA